MLFNQNKNAPVYDYDAVDIQTGKVARKPVTVTAEIDFNGIKNNRGVINVGDRLNSFDREVHDAIASFCFVNPEGYLSSKMLLKVLSGKADVKISHSLEQAILASIDKMRGTELKIDTTNEARVFGYADFKYHGSLLPTEEVVRVRINNNYIENCLHIGKLPLFDYAVCRNQFARVDIGILNVPVQHTPENFSLRGYLLRELLWMKHIKSKRRPVLLYKTLFQYLGIDILKTSDNIRHHIMRVRQKVRVCLDFWKKKNFITNYREEKTEGSSNIKSRIIIEP